MREDIKKRIAAVRHSEVPEGYSKDYCLMPNDWECVSLNRIAKKVSKKNKAGEDIAVLSNSAIRGVVFQHDYFEKDIANEENTDGYFVVEPKDYIYNPRISVHAPFGPINKNNLGCKGIVSPLYTVFRSQNPEAIDEKYLEYFFLSTQWNRFVYTVSNQGVRFDRMNITDDDFFCMPIAIPPLAEQQKIAEILITCDRVIELKQQLLEKMRRQKQWLMQKLLSESFGVNEVTLSELCLTICDGDWIESKDQSESGIRLIQTGNIGVGRYLDKEGRAKHISEETFERLHCTEVFAGDVLLSRLPDPIGRACIISDLPERAITAVDCTIIRFKDTAVAEFFLQYATSAEYFNKIAILAGGSTRTRISRKEIEKLSIPIPTNQTTMQKISEILSLADKEIAMIEQELEAWQQKKKALMQLLLTGLVRTKY